MFSKSSIINFLSLTVSETFNLENKYIINKKYIFNKNKYILIRSIYIYILFYKKIKTQKICFLSRVFQKLST